MSDNLTPEQRSYTMSRVRVRDTALELKVHSALEEHSLTFTTHVIDLPGKPDIVFEEAKLVVFVDGDFWHGYRFPAWKNTLSPFWREKISKTRERDRRNFRKLRRRGWALIRLWQHQIKNDIEGCMDRILRQLHSRQ